MKITLCSFVLILFSQSAFAQINIRLRAREHFVDQHKVKFSDGSSTEYAGLTNTLNIWHEVPFKYSIGFSLSPILGASRAQNASNAPWGNKIQFQSYGVESKFYPYANYKAFLRGGVYHSIISGSSLSSNIEGHSFYLGAGWEFPAWAIHLAPEIGWRESYLQSRIKVNSQVFAVGFHFYKHF